MSVRVPIQPDLLQWASGRSTIAPDAMRKRFPKYDEWEAGKTSPTFKQLQDFAKAMHTPFGYLLLSTPPKINVPIPDYRTMGSQQLGEPSPDLLDTLYACQQRQEWYQEYAQSIGQLPHKFVGSAKLGDDIVKTAAEIRKRLKFDLSEQRSTSNMDQMLSRFRQRAEDIGVLVMIYGVVGSNTHRKLDPGEFEASRSQTSSPR